MSEVDDLLDQFRQMKTQKAEREQAEDQPDPDPDPDAETDPDPDADADADATDSQNSGYTQSATNPPPWMYRTAYTPVYAIGRQKVFHADLDCAMLSSGGTPKKYPLAFIVTRDTYPSKPCDNCTMDMDNTIRVALAYDGVDPDDVVYPSDAVERRQDATGGARDNASAGSA